MLEFPAKRTVTLSSGRQLSYAIYGDAAGAPVYYMHGLYGSRLEAMPAGQAAEKIGVQLIAADRPGVGESTPEPGRSLQSWAGNISELADHLGHDQFSLFGMSGGGPYALACANLLPERIRRMALCGSLAPFNDTATRQQLPFKYRSALWALRYFKPGLKIANYLLYSGARKAPGKMLSKISRHLSLSDKNILADPAIKELFVASLTEAARQGPLYGADELTIFGSDYGFSLSDISAPVDIWHGDQDQVVPVALAHQLADNLPQSKLHILPGEGHFSLPILHSELIFKALLANLIKPD